MANSANPKIIIPEDHPTFRFARDVWGASENFLRRNGLQHFYYTHIDVVNKSAMILTHSPEGCKDVLTTLGFPRGEELEAGVHYLPSYRASKARSDMHKKYNAEQTLEIIRKNNDGIDVFGFATHCNQPEKIHFYLSHLQELEQFGLAFKDQASALITEAKKTPILLPENLHVIETPFDEPMQVNRPFGKRELEVLKAIYQGLTVKETGRQLNLSPRTVEFYLRNIRVKLGLFKKAELVRFCMDQRLF